MDRALRCPERGETVVMVRDTGEGGGWAERLLYAGSEAVKVDESTPPEILAKLDGRTTINPHIILDHPPSLFTWELGCRCPDCLRERRKDIRRRTMTKRRMAFKEQGLTQHGTVPKGRGGARPHPYRGPNVPEWKRSKGEGVRYVTEMLWIVECREHRSAPTLSLRTAMELQQQWTHGLDVRMRCRRKHVIRKVYRRTYYDESKPVMWSWEPRKFDLVMRWGFMGLDAMKSEEENDED